MSISASEIAPEVVVAVTQSRGRRFLRWCRDRFPHHTHNWLALLAVIAVAVVTAITVANQFYYPSYVIPMAWRWVMLGTWLAGLLGIYFWIWGLPSDADGWNRFLTFVITIGIPGWFYGTHVWNPIYTPSADNPWVWAVPPVGVILYIAIQLGLLFTTLEDRLRKFRMMHFFSSAAAFLAAFGAALVIITLHFAIAYPLNLFLSLELYCVLFGTGIEAVLKFFIPYFISSRGIINQGAPAHGAHHGHHDHDGRDDEHHRE